MGERSKDGTNEWRNHLQHDPKKQREKVCFALMLMVFFYISEVIEVLFIVLFLSMDKSS